VLFLFKQTPTSTIKDLQSFIE